MIQTTFRNPENDSIAAYLTGLIALSHKRAGLLLHYLLLALIENRCGGNIVTTHCATSDDYNTSAVHILSIRVNDTVFFTSETVNEELFRAAWHRVLKGSQVCILVPSSIHSAAEQAAAVFTDSFLRRAALFPLEYYVALSLDAVAGFDNAKALHELRRLLLKYNELVTPFEDSSSLKIVIPDVSA